MSKLQVHVATSEDVEWIVKEAGKRMLFEEADRAYLYNEEHLLKVYGEVVKQGVTFVCTCQGERVGVLASMLTPNAYNPKYTSLLELFWWVSPSYRGTRVAAMLLREFERALKEKADEAMFSLLPASSVLVEHFEKRGWKIRELSLTKELV